MDKRNEILKEIKETLQKVAPDAEVIVYGSQARGDFSTNSDIDLLIIIDKDRLSIKEEQEITTPLYKIEIKSGVPISPFVVMKKSWEKRQFKIPFQINILNEGISL